MSRARDFKPPRYYAPLLLKSIREGAVYDWKSLEAFQQDHGLRFYEWGSRRVGDAPAVIPLLEDLERARLVVIEGVDLAHDIWVRKDNFSVSPAGRIVHDPNRLDPNHVLDSPAALSTAGVTIQVSPQWAHVQYALGISLSAVAELQQPRAKIVVPEAFPEPPHKDQYADVFVVMPFSDDLRPVYDDHIAPVCQELSLSVSRADDFFSTHAVMADVWGAIESAKILVADCTQRNPNVFYEIGIAHVLGKPVILLAQKKEDIPFDVHALRYVLYQFTPRGMKEFEKTLTATLLTLLKRS